MNRNQWIIGCILIALLIGYMIFEKGVTNQGIRGILPNYILISTAIFTVTFVVYILGRQIFEELEHELGEAYAEINHRNLVHSVLNKVDRNRKMSKSNNLVFIFSMLCIISSILALIFSNLTEDSSNAAIILFYLATIFVICSIFEMLALAWKLSSVGIKKPDI
ncbi:MAG: hypothetical protein WCC86_04055 [Methanoregula sp.]